MRYGWKRELFRRKKSRIRSAFTNKNPHRLPAMRAEAGIGSAFFVFVNTGIHVAALEMNPEKGALRLFVGLRAIHSNQVMIDKGYGDGYIR
jgi:hypothetical protein